MTAPYITRSAVLFVIFNRPDTTQRVFEQIRQARPPRLYIAADGPRLHKPGEDELCEETRRIIERVDWPCVVNTRFRDENLGCRNGVSTAINWFFENEEEGIILEDDCLPAQSFFRFCDELLEKYRDDKRIWHITGCNLQLGEKWGDASYYFSNRIHVWGWASWRRVWNEYDLYLARYNEVQVKQQMLNIYADEFVAEAWLRIFRDARSGTVNSWAYSLDFCNFFNNGLVIIPNQNLISNIGFTGAATNTLDQESPYANTPLQELDEISHPVFFVPQKVADLSIIYRDFDIAGQRATHNKWHRKLKRWLKNQLK